MTTSKQDVEGVGCGFVAGAFGGFFVFSAVMFIAGLLTTNFSFIFTALPVSAFLTALGGEFVLAWPIDVVVWLVLAFGAAKLAERGERNLVRVMTVFLVGALVYGFAFGLAVEPSGEFLRR